MNKLRIGLIGSGFMGRAHAYAFRAAPSVFDLPLYPELELLSDVDEETARNAAASLGFHRSTGDWRNLVTDPSVDLVDITTPNRFHLEMAMAAIAEGKPVYCEKPLAPSAGEALALVEAAEAAGVVTMVGFNYLKNPMTRLAREIIQSGEIGEIIGYRGCHFEDYMLAPVEPENWRLDPSGGDGVIGDLMSHAISTARYLVGGIAEIMADRDSIRRSFDEEQGGAGSLPAAKVADQVRALVRFESGCTGTLEASWVAAGRKMNHVFEVTGTRGAIILDYERLNELRFYTFEPNEGRDGFKTILAGPNHPPYGNFTPAPGHQLGFNELKMIEVAALVDALYGKARSFPDFREGWEIQRVVDSMVRSSTQGSWVAVEDS